MPYIEKEIVMYICIRRLKSSSRLQHDDNKERIIAESKGFEPLVQLPVHRISSAAHSTTLAAFPQLSFAGTKVRKI